MLFEDICYIDENAEIKKNMYIGTQGEFITYISDKPPLEKSVFGEIYSRCEDKILMSGFYNAHSHMPMYLLRGYAEDMNLQDWLFNKIFPFEAKLNAYDVYAATTIACAEMLRFGIVSTTDMYYNGHEMGRAFIECGVKANFAVTCTTNTDEDYRKIPHCIETIGMIRELGENTRVVPEVALHAEYTTSESMARGVAELAKEFKIATQVHVSETRFEVEECKKRHFGKTPVSYLADCGMFDVRSTAAHCVHITAEDMDILKAYGVSVATCPKSNLKLASGICNVRGLLDKGVNVAVGTDSVSSNNNLNFLEELKMLRLISNISANRADAISLKETLYAGTKGGALSQGRADCGSIEVGNKADIIMLDMDKVYSKPMYNAINNIVFSSCGTDVCMTMVDGVVLYDRGEYKTIDIEKAQFEAQKSIDRILSEV